MEFSDKIKEELDSIGSYVEIICSKMTNSTLEYCNVIYKDIENYSVEDINLIIQKIHPWWIVEGTLENNVYKGIVILPK